MKWLLIALIVVLVVGVLVLARRRPRRTNIRVDHRPPDPRVAQGEAMSHLHRNQQNSGPGSF